MNNHTLSAHHITCDRGERRLLHDLTFEVRAGELLHITGNNGIGKTTLLRALTGLLPFSAGEVRWNQCNIATLQATYYQQLCYLSHRVGIKNDLTVLEHLQLHTGYTDIHNTQDVLKQLDLWDIAHVRARQLSSGQRQRLGLAWVFLSRACVWILDEPFASLDQSTISLTQAIFLQKLQQGISIIVTSHQPLTLPADSVKSLAL